MGCAASGHVTVPGYVIGQRRLSMRPHSLETRILQVEQVDTIVHELSSKSQPEAPFTGEQLGVQDLSMAVESLQEGMLFVDPDFPADQASLGLKESVRWLRCKELGVQGKLWTGKSRGKMKACGPHSYWLAEALAVAAMQPRVLDKVFVAEHITKGYVILRLWRFGKWETVTVDDRIPVPCCITTSCPDEMWPAVIEKAFAKLHGSYAALAGGDTLWGLEDLTGGIAQRLEVPPAALAPVAEPGPGPGAAPVQAVYKPLRQALQAGAIVSCRPRAPMHQLPEGSILLESVVNTRQTNTGCEVKVQDYSEHEPSDAGNQWIHIKDFIMFYTSIIVTTFHNDVTKVQMQEILGWWEVGISSGGSRNNLEKFAMNPQYMLTVTQPDENEQESDDFGHCSFLVALMQEHRRSSILARPPLYPIACFIYKADAPNERLSSEYFLCVSEEAGTGPFINRREVAQRVELEPGHYVVIPATWTSSQQGAFLLRVYALRRFSVYALPQHLTTCAMLPTWVPVTEV